jgi:hypothetical protein
MRGILCVLALGCGGRAALPAPPAHAPPRVPAAPPEREVSILYSNITMLEDGSPTEWTVELGVAAPVSQPDADGDGMGLEPGVMASCVAAKREMIDELAAACPAGVGATDGAASACECLVDGDAVACYSAAAARCAARGDDAIVLGVGSATAREPAAAAATGDASRRCGGPAAVVELSCLCDDELHASSGSCGCVAVASCA